MSDTGATSAMAYCAACDQWRRCRDGLCGSCRDAAKLAEQKDEIERLRAEIALIKLEWQSADQWREQIHQAERERDDARTEVDRLREVHLRGCECATDEACAFARERDEVRARLDRADCTHREGGDTRHCRHDRLCWHCRHDEAVVLLRECRPWVSRGLMDHPAPMTEDWAVLARLDAFLAGEVTR